MFAQLSAFLPDALQTKEPKHYKPPSPDTDAETDVAGPTSVASDEMGVRKKEKRSNEAFIIVRPPPSKTNHPLNLQVQLVPPSASKDRGRRISVDSSVDDGALSRTSSRTDAGSIYSSYSSAGSVSSVGSTSTASSGRRMIIPLYNLQAHNVLTNVVADAGTDARIAKFHKRGVEVIGLAVLEPSEVYGHGGHPLLEAHLNSLSPLGLVQTNQSSLRAASPEPGHITPNSSHISLSSSGHPPLHTEQHSSLASAAAPGAAVPSTPPPSSAKKLFGRFFNKKKDSPASSPSADPATTPTRRSFLPTPNVTPRPQTATGVPMPTKRSSLLLAPSIQPSGAQTAAEPAPMLMPAVLGIQPTLSAPTYPPHGRPNTYAWSVRRWLKGPTSAEGLLGGVVSGMLATALPTAGGAQTASSVEVRFEWLRGAKKGGAAAPKTPNAARRKQSGSSGDRRSVHLPRSNGASTTSLASDAPKPAPARRSGGRSRERGASQSPRRAPPPPPGDAHSIRTASEEHDGDDSDPEDSETPWTCTLVVRRVAGSPAAPAPPDAPGEVRVKVATLSPTPHHPKVVAALKVPFPLPDIDVDAPAVRKRIVTPAGIARPAPPVERVSSAGGAGAPATPRARDALMLTAEEIKDVVSTTGMWLVVREGIGGVGRVARKGDGWRLRS